MSRQKDEGLFLLKPHVHNLFTDKDLYCRISRIVVHSAPKPSTRRIVEYQVNWAAVGEGETLGPLDTRYMVNVNGMDTDTFAFPLPADSYDRHLLETSCIGHFLSTVLAKKPMAWLISFIRTLYDRQQRGKCWYLYSDVSKPADTFFTALRHQEIYIGQDGEGSPIELFETTVTFSLENAPEQIFSVPYDKEDEWVFTVGSEVMKPNSLTKVLPGFKRLTP